MDKCDLLCGYNADSHVDEEVSSSDDEIRLVRPSYPEKRWTDESWHDQTESPELALNNALRSAMTETWRFVRLELLELTLNQLYSLRRLKTTNTRDQAPEKTVNYDYVYSTKTAFCHYAQKLVYNDKKLREHVH